VLKLTYSNLEFQFFSGEDPDPCFLGRAKGKAGNGGRRRESAGGRGGGGKGTVGEGGTLQNKNLPLHH